MQITDALTRALAGVTDAKFEVGRAQDDLNHKLKELRGQKLAKYVAPSDISVAHAEAVTEWCRAFHAANHGWEYNRIFVHLGEYAVIPLFRSRFWLGEPAGDDPLAEATFGITSHDTFRYEERRGNLTGVSMSHVITPMGLSHELHPVFLRKLAERLAGPDAFKEVVDELERAKQRILTTGVR